MSFLAAIPWPLRAVGLLLVGLVAFKLIGAVPAALLIALAAALWVVALTALFYEAGWLNALARAPVIPAFLGFVTNRAAVARAVRAEAGSAAAQAAPSGALDDAERRRLFAEAEAALDALQGVDAAREAIRTRLIDIARHDPENPFGSRAPAVLMLLSGPRGVGKTQAAHACARMMAGLGALRTAGIVTLRESDLRGGGHASATELGRAKAGEALDGALLLDDADWLLQPDPYGGGADGPGVDIGLAILDVAQAHPRRILLLATLSAEAEARLRADPAHARWLGKLTVRSAAFGHLDDAALLAILEGHLAASGWRLENDDATRAARRLLSDLRDRAGAHFDNAEACRRTAEKLIDAAVAESPDAAARRVITRAVARLAEDEVE